MTVCSISYILLLWGWLMVPAGNMKFEPLTKFFEQLVKESSSKGKEEL